MKKIVLVIVLITAFACKNGSKEREKNESPITKEKTEEVLNNLAIPNISLWKHKNITISTEGLSEIGDSIYSLKRIDPSVSAYTFINNLSIYEGSRYKTTILVKKGEKESFFGLRMTSVYPNRADVVFDLETVTVKGTNSVGDFVNEKATIESVGNNLYKCTLSTEVFVNKMMIILGPTTNDKIIPNWEGATNDTPEIFIIPTKVLVQEISL